MSARDVVSLPRLWFGIFGAPFAWAAQLIIDYAIVAHACYPASVPLVHPVVSGAHGITIAVSLVCLAIAGCAVAVAFRSARAARAARPVPAGGESTTSGARVRFMALAGCIVSVLFTFGVLMAALPLFTRPACG